MLDLIFNGQGVGTIASRLLAADMDPNVLRPYVGRDGRAYMTLTQNGKAAAVPVQNSNATLRKDEWIQLDEAVIKVARQRLKAVADIRAAGLTYNIGNGMGKTVLQYQKQSDISPAAISMDGLRKTQNDRPEYDLNNLPLPIIHKDFQLTARQLAASRNGNTPLDTSMAEMAGRMVAEQAEKLLLGVADSYSYGGGTVYGYRNFPDRITGTVTAPTAGGWTPATAVAEVLAMRQDSMDALHYGPWRLYNSPAWDQYLDEDYSAAKGDNTLRERLRKIANIGDISTLDYLPAWDLILVQQTSDVVRLVVGMDFTTVQWEEQGGMQLNYKVMGILVPQLRSDMNNNTGIVHYSAA